MASDAPGAFLTSDNKPAQDDKEDDFVESHAADEPTAVWDEKSLRAAGLQDLLKQPQEPPLPPATPAGGVSTDPSIVVDTTIGPNARPLAPNAPKAAPQQPVAVPSDGMGWPTTVGIALGLGALVYILIRLVKG